MGNIGVYFSSKLGTVTGVAVVGGAVVDATMRTPFRG
jgi:hypothetical protein